MSLIQLGTFTSHSGIELDWKIDCDALTDDDINALAAIVSRQLIFNRVISIPRGGDRLAKALKSYISPVYNRWALTSKSVCTTLIVDDVLTTGKSMELALSKEDKDARGLVIFARSRPNWRVYPIFKTFEWK
jgi:hypoxanthine phosphoribosyltransferase